MSCRCKAVQNLFDQTPLNNRERLLALAEVMDMTLEDALQERELREGQRADVEVRRRLREKTTG